ncbi:MAG: FtsW/RodA/SpoVE family cell cycle protein [Kiritimatiellia bacterium]
MFLRIVLLPYLLFLPLHASLLAVRLANAPELEWEVWAPAVLFLSVLLITWLTLHFGKYRGSPAVPSLVLALLGVGIAIQYRIGTLRTVEISSPSQLALPIGIVAMLAVYLLLRHGRINRLEPFWPVFLGLSILVISLVLILGRAFRGAFFLAGGINPVEIIKPLMIIAIATFLAGHRLLLRRGFLGIPLPPLNILTTVAIIWAPPMILLLAQGDMGMFALMNITLLVMLYAVTNRSLYLIGGIAAIFAAARFLIPLTARGRARLIVWSDPFQQATGTGWQPLQALVALYQGGFWGTGLGAGAPNVVPIVESDFAYIIIGEELGFLGCGAIILLFCALILSGMRIASRAESAYAACIATGITACIGIQTLFNIGGVVKAIPLTGITLPLLSHGGSSLVTTLLMTGVLLAISDERLPKKTPPSKSSSRPRSKP